MMIDLLDRQLIALLEKDTSQSSEKLAEQLSISSSTVRRRMKDLVSRGVIRIIAIPEPKEIGLPLTAIIAFQLEHDKLNTFFKELGSRNDVKYLYATTGRFDVIALMWFSSTEQLYEFMEKEASKIEGVKTSETFVCLHVEKSF